MFYSVGLGRLVWKNIDLNIYNGTTIIFYSVGLGSVTILIKNLCGGN